MKFFTIIFSFYILVLSSIPCVDSIAIISDLEQKVSTTTHHNHSSDMCTPFCSCTCCGQIVNIIFHNVVANNFSNILLKENFSIYKASFVSERHTNIWHPPKIS